MLTSFASGKDGDTWTLTLNKKVLARGTTSEENAAATIYKSVVKSAKNALEFVYKSDAENKDWNRTILLNDANDVSYSSYELKSQSGTVSIPVTLLKKLVAKNEPVYIYTVSVPKDANLAALVRVRRILLVKIDWR